MLVCAALGRAGATWRGRKRSRVNATRHVDTQALYLEQNLVGDREPHELPREHAEAMFGGRINGVSRVAALYNAQPECLQASLVRYTADLIVERRAHHPERLADALQECVNA